MSPRYGDLHRSVADFLHRFHISKREWETIQLVLAGLPNREIAEQMGVAERTIKAHITHIYDKLGIENKIGLFKMLHEYNLLPNMNHPSGTPPRAGTCARRPAEIHENRFVFLKTLTGEDRVFLNIGGFGATPKDYDIRVEDQRVGAGVRITGDRPLSKMALWAIRAPLSIEPFIDMNIEPGAAFTWRITYEFYTIPKGRG